MTAINRGSAVDLGEAWGVTTPPAIEPITRDQVKASARIDGTSDDADIDILIAAARDFAEKYTGRTFIRTTRWVAFDEFPELIKLPYPPLIDVVNIQYNDPDGLLQTVSALAYQVDSRGHPARIAPAPNSVWPSTQAGAFNAVVVNYTAGYGTAAVDVPAPIRAWLIRMVTHLYEAGRSLMAENLRLDRVPFVTEYMLGPYRVTR